MPFRDIVLTGKTSDSKSEVLGSNPSVSVSPLFSVNHREINHDYSSGQREQTVNLRPLGFGGSNPSSWIYL